MTYEVIFSNELYHHGILGQKWGIRRYQNSDGTYTAAGKARYAQYKEDILNRKKAESGKIKEFNKMGETIQDKADELYDEYTKAFKNMKFSDKQKEEIWAQLRKDLVSPDMIDDPFLYEMDVEDLVSEKMMESLPDDLKQKRKEFDDYQEKYWDDIHDFTDKIVKEYSNVKVSGIKDVSTETRKIIQDSIDTMLPAYIYRHFDDYWVYDTDERHEAYTRLSEDFSLDEFRKHS